MGLQTILPRQRFAWFVIGCVTVLFLDRWTKGTTGWSHFPSVQDVQNSTLGFEKIFVLNLPHRTDRRDNMLLSAAVSNLDFDFIEGSNGSTIPLKYLPPGVDRYFLPGAIGCWKAHMDALRQVVAQNLSTALILEDDIDWDVRIKDSMQDFAIASHAVLQHPKEKRMSRNALPATKPKSSPYGEGWDMLWIGHCGMMIDDQERSHVVQNDDATVPQTQFLGNWPDSPNTQMIAYPQHSRLTGHGMYGICAFAYAVTQASARKLLHEFGVKRFSSPYDILLSEFCVSGSCISVVPQLFDNHRTKGSQAFNSDIDLNSEPERDEARTKNIRYSVRMNMDKLIDGRTDYTDQYPDVDE